MAAFIVRVLREIKQEGFIVIGNNEDDWADENAARLLALEFATDEHSNACHWETLEYHVTDLNDLTPYDAKRIEVAPGVIVEQDSGDPRRWGWRCRNRSCFSKARRWVDTEEEATRLAQLHVNGKRHRQD